MKYFVVLVLGLFSFASAQAESILFISSQKNSFYQSLEDSFMGKMKENGYEEGKNLEVTRYELRNNLGRAKNIWEHKVGDQKFNVVVTMGTVATVSAKQHAWNKDGVNVVFLGVADPVSIGVIDGFVNKPMGNITGVSIVPTMQKRIEFIKKIHPEARKLGLIYAEMPQGVAFYNSLKNQFDNKDGYSLHAQGIKLIKTDKGPSRMIEIMAKKYLTKMDQEVDYYHAPADSMGVNPALGQTFLEQSKKPLIGLLPTETKKHQAIGTLAADFGKSSSQAAAMAVRILKGESLKDIIPEEPKVLVEYYSEKRLADFGTD